jgi:Bacterial SH3 domain
LVLWSAQSIEFEVVTNEALEARKQGNLVSISIDGSAPPAEFADLPTIFLPDTTAGLDEVVAAIKSRAPRNVSPEYERLRKFGHVLVGSATALGLTMAAVTFWLNLPPPKRLGQENLGIAASSPTWKARYQTNFASPRFVATNETLKVPPTHAQSPANAAAAAEVLAKVRMTLGTCVVSDPSGTPLNLRAAPQGAVVSTLANGRSVQITDTKSDRKGQLWVQVASNESGERLGWVIQNSIICP